MKGKKNIDEFIKDGLGDFRMEPPKKVKRKVLAILLLGKLFSGYKKYVVVSGILLLAAVAMFYGGEGEQIADEQLNSEEVKDAVGQHGRSVNKDDLNLTTGLVTKDDSESEGVKELELDQIDDSQATTLPITDINTHAGSQDNGSNSKQNGKSVANTGGNGTAASSHFSVSQENGEQDYGTAEKNTIDGKLTKDTSSEDIDLKGSNVQTGGNPKEEDKEDGAKPEGTAALISKEKSEILGISEEGLGGSEFGDNEGDNIKFREEDSIGTDHEKDSANVDSNTNSGQEGTVGVDANPNVNIDSAVSSDINDIDVNKPKIGTGQMMITINAIDTVYPSDPQNKNSVSVEDENTKEMKDPKAAIDSTNAVKNIEKGDTSASGKKLKFNYALGVFYTRSVSGLRVYINEYDLPRYVSNTFGVAGAVNYKNNFIQTGLGYQQQTFQITSTFTADSIVTNVRTNLKFDSTHVLSIDTVITVVNDSNMTEIITYDSTKVTVVDTSSVTDTIYSNQSYNDTGVQKLKLNYLSIPLFFGHNFQFNKHGVEVSGGVVLNFLLNSEEVAIHVPETSKLSPEKFYFDYYLSVGYSYMIFPQLDLYGKFSYSIVNKNPVPTSTSNQRYTGGVFGVRWRFD